MEGYMQILRKIDNLAFGILTLGALTALADNLLQRDRQNSPTTVGRLAYAGLMGTAAIYRLGRMAAPKPASERRLEKLAQLNDQADGYINQMQQYRQDAERLVRDLTIVKFAESVNLL
jgi:uncharacterized protein YkwD